MAGPPASASGFSRRCPVCDTAGDHAICPNDGMATLLIDAPRSDAKRVQSGMVIGGRYRVKALLGQGAFGAVFEATHIGTGQSIALKVLSGGEQDDATALKRFFIEARVTASLQHPNTVRVFDFGQDDSGLVYIAMELLKGRTLGEELRSRLKVATVFTEAEAVDIANGVARSLGEAHAAGLVHRDLKPENIFLHELPGGDRVTKVLDFGIAKNLSASLTVGSMVIGTPGYMSPEQARSMPLDRRSDIYSLGAVLFRLVSGRLPFIADAPVQLLMMHVSEPLPDLRVLTRTPLSEGFVLAVERAMAKEPAERFATADQMRLALASAASRPFAAPTPRPQETPPAEPAPARRATPGPVTPAHVTAEPAPARRATPGPVTPAHLTAEHLPAAQVAPAHFATATMSGTAALEAIGRPSRKVVVVIGGLALTAVVAGGWWWTSRPPIAAVVVEPSSDSTGRPAPAVDRLPAPAPPAAPAPAEPSGASARPNAAETAEPKLVKPPPGAAVARPKPKAPEVRRPEPVKMGSRKLEPPKKTEPRKADDPLGRRREANPFD